MLNTSSSLHYRFNCGPYVIVLVRIGVLQLTIRNVNVYGELTMLHIQMHFAHLYVGVQYAT